MREEEATRRGFQSLADMDAYEANVMKEKVLKTFFEATKAGKRQVELLDGTKWNVFAVSSEQQDLLPDCFLRR